jgi:adenylate kinase
VRPAVHPALHVVMLGPPGAGKGTQSERVARRYGLKKIATGDILRQAIKSVSPLGCVAKEAIDSGKLVGDDAVIGIVQERLDRDDTKAGFVLDGFPRTVVQAVALDRMMAARGALVVLDIVVPEDILVHRLASRRICSVCGTNAAADAREACLACGGVLVVRTDDDAGVVRERLKVYQRQTQPLVDYYSTRPTFRSIGGNRSPDVVTTAIEQAVTEALAAGGARR